MFKESLPDALLLHVNMFHSRTLTNVKEDIRLDMQSGNGQIHVLIATNSRHFYGPMSALISWIWKEHCITVLINDVRIALVMIVRTVMNKYISCNGNSLHALHLRTWHGVWLLSCDATWLKTTAFQYQNKAEDLSWRILQSANSVSTLWGLATGLVLLHCT